MRILKRTLLPLCLGSLALSSAQGAITITELLYDVCNESTLGDGTSTNSGEYFVIHNSGPAAVELDGAQFGDTGLTDTLNLGGSQLLGVGQVAIIGGTTQASWEAEYGPVAAGVLYIDGAVASGGSFPAYNNGGDSAYFQLADTTDAANSGSSFGDLVVDGENIIWDVGTAAWVAGGVVSLNQAHGGQQAVPGTGPTPDVVPEPSRAVLLLVGACALLLRRKR